MSQNTQADGTHIPSVVQPGAQPSSPPRPLPGLLTLGTKVRVGAYSDVYKGMWKHDLKEEEVCIKCLRNTAPAVDPTCPDLTPAQRFERVCESGVTSDCQES